MKYRFFIFLIIAICLPLKPVYAALPENWMSQYELTEQQAQILQNWEAQGKYSDEFILKAAQTFERYNLRPQVYVPEHTPEDLVAVIDWAAGAAFAIFAHYAGYQFDGDSYDQDCPHRALYNFGYATETLHLKTDVLQRYFRTFDYLAWKYRTSPQDFSQIYWERAQQDGFSQYLTPIDTNSLQFTGL